MSERYVRGGVVERRSGCGAVMNNQGEKVFGGGSQGTSNGGCEGEGRPVKDGQLDSSGGSRAAQWWKGSTTGPGQSIWNYSVVVLDEVGVALGDLEMDPSCAVQ